MLFMFAVRLPAALADAVLLEPKGRAVLGFGEEQGAVLRTCASPPCPRSSSCLC